MMTSYYLLFTALSATVIILFTVIRIRQSKKDKTTSEYLEPPIMGIDYGYIEKYDNQELYSAFQNAMDELEEQIILYEMAKRKHPEVPGICLGVINARMKFERDEKSFNYTQQALDSLYIYDKSIAISFFKIHYKDLPLDAVGSFIDNYAYVYHDGEVLDKELITMIKQYLSELGGNQIEKIRAEYDWFMKTYGSNLT